MATLTKPFKIIMDEDYDPSGPWWEYVYEDDTVEGACSQTQFDGIIGQLPTALYRAVFQEKVELEYSRGKKGLTYKGAIYRVTEKL